MSEPVSRALVESFYAALANGDWQALDPYLADDVVWTISGPVDVLPFCGERRGKNTVLRLLDRDISLLLEKRQMTPQAMLVDGDRAAVFGRLTAKRSDIGYAISYRVAQFIQFRNGQVIEYISLIDSFDAAEQVLGRPLAGPQGPRRGDGLVSV